VIEIYTLLEIMAFVMIFMQIFSCHGIDVHLEAYIQTYAGARAVQMNDSSTYR